MRQILGTGLSGLVGSRIIELLGQKYNFIFRHKRIPKPGLLGDERRLGEAGVYGEKEETPLTLRAGGGFINLDLSTGVDITNREKIEQKIYCSKAAILIHLAAFTNVDKAWEEKNDKDGLCYRINVLGTRNIAQSCQKYHKYLIHISTDFVFDGEKREPYVEEDRPYPIEWYGQTKLWAEEEVKRSGCKFVILRIAFPFKAKSASKNLETKPKLDLVRKIIQKFKTGQTLPMFFDQVITPTFIDDIAKVVDYCLANKPEGIYHCVGSTSLSPYELASIVADVFDFDKTLIKKTSLRELEGKNLRPRQVYLALSNKKLTKELGIKMSEFRPALEEMEKQLLGFATPEVKKAK